MGGQACVFYGAAEFSRDVDLAILASDANLGRLRTALTELRAEVIAVPPFEARYLRRGHAVHFRCREGETAGLRIDVMTRMRGVDAFPGSRQAPLKTAGAGPQRDESASRIRVRNSTSFQAGESGSSASRTTTRSREGITKSCWP